jgi:hypothetical protein
MQVRVALERIREVGPEGGHRRLIGEQLVLARERKRAQLVE